MYGHIAKREFDSRYRTNSICFDILLPVAESVKARTIEAGGQPQILQ